MGQPAVGRQVSLQTSTLLLLQLLAGFSWLGATSAEAQSGGNEELLIGWKGDTYQPQLTKNVSTGTPWVETIAWAPRAFVYHNFLTPEECDHLVTIGNKRVTRSMVVDSKTGASKLDDIRTSFGAAFGRGEDPVIAEVEERIAEWTHLPPEHGEPIQILRYVDGQKYDAHWDWFDDPVHHQQYLQNGNRYATVLMYLSEVEEGGETTLPLADAIDAEAQTLDHPSQCAQRMGIAVRPRKGDALLFFDMDISGSKGDRKALHASCPTLKGTKWTATKWIHNKPYMGGYDSISIAGQCKDLDHDCASRESTCMTDPKMIGPAGRCRKTCQDCVPCAQGDILCYRQNMRSRRRALAARGSSRGADGAPSS